MKLVTYKSPTGPRVAAMRDGAFVDINETDATLPSDMVSLLNLGPVGMVQAALATGEGKLFGRQGIQLLAPVLKPGKIICIGLNYRDHAAETGREPPPEPVVFSKFVTTIQAPGEPIVLPPVSSKVDYEAELVAVIGLKCKNVPVEEALAYVAGYCCGHDVSARDWQVGKPEKQWLLGKSFDTFAPLGPYLVTSDEVGDPGQLHIQFRLNGQVLQESNTNNLIFSVAQLVSYVSQVATLEPGDLIYTGTPAGVGVARKPPVYLQPGDVAEVEIEKLGILRNPVIAAVPTPAEDA